MMEEQGYDAILVAIGMRDQLTKEAARDNAATLSGSGRV
jgi:hypothetical protein